MESDKSSNYDGENCDEAHISEPQSCEETPTDYRKESVREEVDDVLQDDLVVDVSREVKEEESDNQRPTTDRDPLVELILSLQALQETLERGKGVGGSPICSLCFDSPEVQMFAEIGWEHVLLFDDFIPGHSLPVEFASVDPEIHEPTASGQSNFEEIELSSSQPLEAQLIKLKQKVNHLESNLEEASAIRKAKEVIEVEAIFNRGEKLKEESRSTLKSLQEKCREMEVELEGLFKQKIEAEVEHLAITRTTQKLKVAAEHQFLLLEEQKSLAGEQTQMLQNVKDEESEAVLLRRQEEESEAFCEMLLLGTEESLKMQNRVLKFTICFLVQLILLFVAFGVFLLQLLPDSTGFAPT